MALRWAWRWFRRSKRTQVQSLIPPPFDPYNGLFGSYPSISPGNCPTLVPGSTGPWVAYLQGILFWKANQPCRPQPLSNSGAWGFGPTTAQCVRNFKAFFGIPGATSATVDLNTWNAIQYCANNLPNRTL